MFNLIHLLISQTKICKRFRTPVICDSRVFGITRSLNSDAKKFFLYIINNALVMAWLISVRLVAVLRRVYIEVAGFTPHTCLSKWYGLFVGYGKIDL